MERVLVNFVTALRHHGLRISPAENLDAIRALTLGGVADRHAVRNLLRLTLVKQEHDIAIFESVFEQFFSRAVGAVEDGSEDLFLQILTKLEAEAFQDAMDKQNENRTATFSLDDVEFSPNDFESLRAVENQERDGSEIEIKLDGYRAKRENMIPTLKMPQNPVTMAFHHQGSANEITPFSAEEIATIEELVARMITRLKKEVRQERERQHRGRLHVIRTLQKNYRHDMVPFLRSFRRKIQEKPRLVVLCDVSFSVSHASRFLLLLLHTLHNRLLDVRSFVFNHEVAEITAMLENMNPNDLLRTIENGDVVNLDDNSNYGHVLKVFSQKHLATLRGKPAVIILGDARNNYQEPELSSLEEIHEKAGYILWLNPEEKALWQRGDCVMEKYQRFCDRVECVQNIDDLSRFVEELFRNVYLNHPAPRASRSSLRPPTPPEPVSYQDYYRRGNADSAPREFDPNVRRSW